MSAVAFKRSQVQPWENAPRKARVRGRHLETKAQKAKRLKRAWPQLRTSSSASAETVVNRVLDAWEARYRLTNAESELLYAATRKIGGQSVLAAARRTLTSTVKKQAFEVCRKTGAPSLMGAALLVVREALRAATLTLR